MDNVADEKLFGSYGFNVQSKPIMAATLAELQTEHNYANSINQSWFYTVENAVSLQVTFDERSYTEGGCDPVYVGALSEWENNYFYNEYSGDSLAGQTIAVEGDTLAIRFRTDGSVTYWGFAVTQIVATMADGSTVTITE